MGIMHSRMIGNVTQKPAKWF